MQNNKVMYPIYDNGEIHISISKGNKKVGNIPQFNTLPGDEPLSLQNGTQLTNIKGTCGGVCENCKSACYAIKCCTYHHRNVIPAWGRNTVLVRNNPELVRSEIKEYCTKNIVRYFRFHTAGEFESVEHFALYCDICRDNPDVTFYVYTKAFKVLVDYAMKYEIPENFVINLSVWHDNIEKFQKTLNTHENIVFQALICKSNLFIYDDHTAAVGEYANNPHCPAIDKTGHETGVTCAQCRRCMKLGNRTAVYNH